MDRIHLGRRQFIKQMATASAALAAASTLPGCMSLMGEKSTYDISLAQWSLHRRFFSGEADPMNFAQIARQEFDIGGIEYVNQFYKDTLSEALVQDLRARADRENVQSLLIMVDGEGALGAPSESGRKQTVDNHKKWADAAHGLGCHSIRVNAQSEGTWDEQRDRAAEGLVMLAEYCEPLGLNVLVENHGGLSSNARWLSQVMETANHPRVGTLPDFGNFVIDQEAGETYDRYRGVRELMPYARAVSAKSYAFNEQGEETTINFQRMIDIVMAVGYNGWVGIEYEGDKHSEAEGIRLTGDLLRRIKANRA
ncbi:sugar phosphate isomerase/epimerase family protein [Marinimicrobium locisalis]|uniref:sugar phosphate isomerase/epimerase family protein n=1 Tax=Marinimicrobium locisalis TaxID=546022 RepID=UPI003221B4A7